MKIVNTGRCHIVRMYNTMYSADSMELISIVVYTLGCAIAPVGRSLTIIPSHGAALGSCVLTNFDRFGVVAFIMQAMKQKIFAIEAERFGRNAKSYNLKVGKFGNNTTSRYISEFINTISGEILADTENSNEIRYEVAHKR